jgi:hypothetical protein
MVGIGAAQEDPVTMINAHGNGVFEERLTTIEEFVRKLFDTDIDVYLYLGETGKEKLVIMTTAWYDQDGKRHWNERRHLLAPAIEQQTYEQIRDLLGCHLTYEEIVSRLHALESRGFKLTVV